MATKLQPHLASLVEKKRQELTSAIQRLRKTLSRMEREFDKKAEFAEIEIDGLHRECGEISRICAELQTLESVGKLAPEIETAVRPTRPVSRKKSRKMT
jgi:hypothetical protein